MSNAGSQHVPVLLKEVLDWLNLRPGQVIVDGTVGGGGHAAAILERVSPDGFLIGIDRDPTAIELSRRRLFGLPCRLIHGNFADLPEILSELQIDYVDGVLLDLGLSSDQLADSSRGFSFQVDGPLDLRFDPSCGEPAQRLVNRLSAQRLAELIYRYGEEPMSRRIAEAIVSERRKGPITSSGQLAEIVRRVMGRDKRRWHHPATQTFQALRIAVNDELRWIATGLRRIPECIRPGGRFVVISFHSLEDRLVKQAFRSDSRLQVLAKHAIRPSSEELAVNPRARSARLRAAQRRV